MLWRKQSPDHKSLINEPTLLVSPADWYRPTDRSTDGLTDWLTDYTSKPKNVILVNFCTRERQKQRHREKRKWKIMIRCWRWDECVEWQREIQHQKEPRERDAFLPGAYTRRENNSETMKKKRRAGKSETLSLGCCLGILFKDSQDRAWPFWYSMLCFLSGQNFLNTFEYFPPTYFVKLVP